MPDARGAEPGLRTSCEVPVEDLDHAVQVLLRALDVQKDIGLGICLDVQLPAVRSRAVDQEERPEAKSLDQARAPLPSQRRSTATGSSWCSRTRRGSRRRTGRRYCRRTSLCDPGCPRERRCRQTCFVSPCAARPVNRGPRCLGPDGHVSDGSNLAVVGACRQRLPVGVICATGRPCLKMVTVFPAITCSRTTPVLFLSSVAVNDSPC